MKMLALVALVIACLRKSLQEIIHSNIDGTNPKAIDLLNNEVFLLHSKGALKFSKSRITQITLPPSYVTDEYSNLFRLNETLLVLVKNKTMVVTIFKNDLYQIASKENSESQEASEEYQYSIISNSLFIITYGFSSYLCHLTDQNDLIIDPITIISLGNKDNLSCDYSEIFKVLLCAYTDTQSNSINFKLFNVQTNLTQSLEDNIPFGKYPLIRANKKLNSFTLCYYYILIVDVFKKLEFNCKKLSLQKGESGFTLLSSLSNYSTAIGDNNQINYDIKYINNSLFVVFYNSNKFMFNYLSPSNIKIANEKQIECTSCNYSFIYSLGSSVGYVYQTNEKTNIILYPYLECNNQLEYGRISTTGSLKLDRKTQNTVFAFYHFPLNSYLLQNNEYISSNYNYSSDTFNYVNFNQVNDASWLFIEMNPNQQSLLCNVTLRICYTSCSECSWGSDGTSVDHKCNECQEGYYKYIDNKSNCAKEGEQTALYYFNSESEQFESCNEACASCDGIGNEETTNCNSCANLYYPFEDNEKNCSKTGSGLNYYLDNKVFKKCYESCKTCTKGGSLDKHNCDECHQDYSKGTTVESQCYRKCEISHDIKNPGICIKQADATCKNPLPIVIDKTNECVSKCTNYQNPDCIACQTNTLFYFSGNQSCLYDCPTGYVKRYKTQLDNECILEGGGGGEEEGGDQITMKVFQEEILKDSFLSSAAYDSKNFTDYLDKIKALQSDNNGAKIDLIVHQIGEDYSLTYFKANNEEVYNKIYNIKARKVSEIDFTSFSLNKTMNLSQILVMQWEMFRSNELTSQVRYKLYHLTSESDKLNESFQQQPINISYRITGFLNPSIQDAITLGKKGINIYNASSPFFNDVCFRYVDEKTNLDLSVLNRISRYYPKSEVCEVNCKLISIDQEKEKANCLCAFNDTFSNQIVPNPPFPEWKEKDVETYNVVKCIEVVFNKDALKTNVSFWVFLSFLVIIVILAFCFIYSGMSYASNYVKMVLDTKQKSLTQFPSRNIPRSEEEKINISSES